MNKLFYQVLLLILFLQNIHSQKQRANLPLNSIDTFSARKDKNSCDVNPSDIIPQGDYFGDCIDGKADGLGILYFNDKSAIKGYFKNNILQNSIVEFKYPKEYNTYVGLYNNGKLNGPFIYYRFSDYYSDLFVSSTNFNEGRNVDSEWDYFTIPEPIKISDNVFPLFQEWKGVKNPIYDIIDSFEKPHEIPNSTQVLFTVRRRNNPNGYTNPSLALYDINTNTVIREFGSYTNPLNFLTFTPDFKSFYATKINLKVKKIVKVEISSGLISSVPIEQEKSIFNNLKSDKPKKSITTSKYNYKAVNDSKNNNAEFTINGLDGKIHSRLQLNQKVIDNFAIDENSQKVLIVEFVNGVTQWNLYSLDNLEFIKQIHTFNSLVSGQIGFSSQGKFLYYSVENKTFLFKDYKLYFAVPGEFYGFNNDDNIILTSKRGYGVLDNLKNTPNYSTLEAYDLLNKSVLWKTKLHDSPISYGGFKVGNEFFVLTKSPGGAGDKKPHIIRYNLNYPTNPDLFFKVNLNLQDEKKSLLALQAQKLIEKNTSSVVNTNLSNNSNETEEYSLTDLKNQGCDVIKSEFKKFANKYISYRKRVKSNPYSLRIREDTEWENNLRKYSDLATTCAIKMKGNYSSEVFGYLNNISALLPIDLKTTSSNNNKSYSQNKSATSSKKEQANVNIGKKVDNSSGYANSQTGAVSIGNCRFTGPEPGRGMSLSIASDVQLFHNGSFKQTSIGGGVNYYTGDGDIWIIYRNPESRTKYNFKTTSGKVQTCDSY